VGGTARPSPPICRRHRCHLCVSIMIPKTLCVFSLKTLCIYILSPSLKNTAVPETQSCLHRNFKKKTEAPERDTITITSSESAIAVIALTATIQLLVIMKNTAAAITTTIQTKPKMKTLLFASTDEDTGRHVAVITVEDQKIFYHQLFAATTTNKKQLISQLICRQPQKKEFFRPATVVVCPSEVLLRHQIEVC